MLVAAGTTDPVAPVTVLVTAGTTDPVAPVTVLVTAGTTDSVAPVTVPVTAGSVLPVRPLTVPVAGSVLPVDPVPAGRVVPVIPVTVLVTAGRAEPVLPAAGSAVLVTAATGLVTVGWVGLETVEIAPVRPASEPTGFGPEVAAVAVGWAGVVWVLPVSAPVTVVAVCGALAVRWLTGLVTLATADAGAVAAGWLVAWLPAGCVAAGWAAADCAPAGWDAAGWVWADGPWLLPRPWVALLTVPVTPLTAPARPLVAGGGEPAAWPAPLAVADGCAGAAGWLARLRGARLRGARLGRSGLGGSGLGCCRLGRSGLRRASRRRSGRRRSGLGRAGRRRRLGWVRLCTALLAAPVSELSADPAPLVPDDPGAPEDPGSVAAEARPARRNAKMSAAAIPPQTHRETLRARPKALVRVADPSTARRLHRVPIIIHTYPPVLSGQNRRSEADNPTDVLPDHT